MTDLEKLRISKNILPRFESFKTKQEAEERTESFTSVFTHVHTHSSWDRSSVLFAEVTGAALVSQ